MRKKGVLLGIRVARPGAYRSTRMRLPLTINTSFDVKLFSDHDLFLLYRCIRQFWFFGTRLNLFVRCNVFWNFDSGILLLVWGAVFSTPMSKKKEDCVLYVAPSPIVYQ